MPPIETIARPHRNRISVLVPREYGSHSFHVILVPLGVAERPQKGHDKALRKASFVDALLSCPKLDDGDTLDISRDESDFGRDLSL